MIRRSRKQGRATAGRRPQDPGVVAGNDREGRLPQPIRIPHVLEVRFDETFDEALARFIERWGRSPVDAVSCRAEDARRNRGVRRPRLRQQEHAKQPEGLTKIRSVLDGGYGDDVLSILNDYPPYLLGRAEGARVSLFESGVKRHAPEAQVLFDGRDDLNKVAAKYPRAIAGMKSSFYVPALAKQAKLRVEI